MEDWFSAIAKDVMVFCNGFRHHGTAYGEQDNLDPAVIHINTSRGGVFNVHIMANRKDHCAASCPQEVEFVPAAPEAPDQAVPV